MTDQMVRYLPSEQYALVAVDDGKVNALSHAMFDAFDSALDAAAADEMAIVVVGRAGCFSAGFHLPTLLAGGDTATSLVRRGFELAHRLLAWPRPVVAGCTGHAFAMGAFLLLAADHRVAADGAFSIAANEVEIGLTMPRPALVLCRSRLTVTHLRRVVLGSERFAPEGAMEAGFVDEVVPADVFDERVREVATRLGSLDAAAFAGSKARLHADLLADLASAIEEDTAEFARSARAD